MTAPPPSLGGSWLGRRIAAAGGPWRYDEVIDALLYDAEHGFYGSGRGGAGRNKDFLTSPEVGPLFGAVLARYLDEAWVEAGRPDPFVVAEVGAGAGTLARAVRAAEPACAGVLDLVAVERSVPLRARHPRGVRSSGTLPPRAHLVLANELLDNLPFRLAAWGTDGWREVLVGPDGEEPGPPLDDARLPPGSIPGGRVPLQDAAADWVTRARRCAARVLLVDYGSLTAELAGRPWLDWVRTYRAHGRGGHPLDQPGDQDVTCEVAWDQLPSPSGRWSQAAFLRRLGIADLVEEGRRAWRAGAATADLTALRGRSRVREAEALLDPAGLGGFDVLEWRDDQVGA